MLSNINSTSFVASCKRRHLKEIAYYHKYMLNKHKLDDVFDEPNESGLFKSINYSSRIDAMLS